MADSDVYLHGPLQRVARGATGVMFVETADELTAIRLAWARLEELLGRLQGRKFFGTFDALGGLYRASVLVQDADKPDKLGLQSGVIPGGDYLRARLRGEPPEVYVSIPKAFSLLERSASKDPTRPGIEFYRQRDQIDLFMPLGRGFVTAITTPRR